MTRPPEIPPDLAALLDGSDLGAKVGRTFLLLTVDGEGWPHAAMLSVGEVLAVGPRQLRLALWPGSTTTGNLDRSGRALLMAVLPPVTYHLRLRCGGRREIAAAGRELAAFDATVDEVREDVVGYARVVGGIDFELAEAERTVAAWTEAVAALGADRG